MTGVDFVLDFDVLGLFAEDFAFSAARILVTGVDFGCGFVGAGF